MIYRVICKYLPDANVNAVGRPGRGAWRVVACAETTSASAAVLRPVLCLANLSPKLLVVSSPLRRQPNSWCSPRKILAEWLLERAVLAECRKLDQEEIAYHAGIGGD